MAGDKDLRDILAVVADLGAVLRDEIIQVRSMRIDAIRALQEPKARLAEAYAKGCADLAAKPGGLGNAAPGLKAELRRAHDELKALVAENARLLAGARDVNERLVRALADAATRQAAGPAGRYGPKAPGRAAASHRKASIPLAFDGQA
ncbi:MAG: hypothetical protein WD673_09510 [Alphaproteobacteria bacterium]